MIDPKPPVIRRAAAFAARALLWTAALASPAQDARAEGPGRAAYTQVGKSCAADLQRLCPHLQGGAPDGRNQAICLKSYRSSLSLGCRGAVRAVRR